MPPADGATGYRIATVVDTLGARRWPDAGSSRIPNWVYTDAGIFAREQELIFEGPGWLYVCLEAEIAEPGDFKRSRLGAKEVVAVRDAAARRCRCTFSSRMSTPPSSVPSRQEQSSCGR
jgi:hypothetical protein